MAYETTVLSVSKGLYDHKGLLFPLGMVLHASKKKGRVVLEPLEAFAQGKKVWAKNVHTRLGEDEILRRGYALLGKRYNPVSFNCEHLLSDVLGKNVGSPQLKAFFIFGLLAVVGVLVMRSRTV